MGKQWAVQTVSPAIAVPSPLRALTHAASEGQSSLLEHHGLHTPVPASHQVPSAHSASVSHALQASIVPRGPHSKPALVPSAGEVRVHFAPPHAARTSPSAQGAGGAPPPPSPVLSERSRSRRARVGRDGLGVSRAPAWTGRLLADRRHQADAPALREGTRVRRDVHRRGSARGAHPPPQRRADGRRRADRRGPSWSWSTCGEALSRLLRRSHAFGGPLDPRIAVAILIDTLHGLHAAHTATSEAGHPLDIVHRDISPQNIMVGADGVARVSDFGIAKAKGREHTTQDSAIKGQARVHGARAALRQGLTPQADVYAAAVVLWEALAGRRMYEAEHEAQLVTQVLDGVKTAPSELNAGVSPALDQVVMQALSVDPSHRFPTAMAMASALEGLGPPALRGELAEWVRANGPSLSDRSRRVQDVEVDSAEAVAERRRGLGARPRKRRPHHSGTSTPSRRVPTRRSPTGDRPEKGRGPRAALALGAALLVGAGAAYLLVSRPPAPASATAKEASSASETAPALSSTIEVSLASGHSGERLSSAASPRPPRPRPLARRSRSRAARRDRPPPRPPPSRLHLSPRPRPPPATLPSISTSMASNDPNPAAADRRPVRVRRATVHAVLLGLAAALVSPRATSQEKDACTTSYVESQKLKSKASSRPHASTCWSAPPPRAAASSNPTAQGGSASSTPRCPRS
ncbi:MAG: serine/threonine protein kinase [Polyangiaceae bacterium]|nr:serine/threonine protein kinase [Polyangiaceae bacterium]